MISFLTSLFFGLLLVRSLVVVLFCNVRYLIVYSAYRFLVQLQAGGRAGGQALGLAACGWGGQSDVRLLGRAAAQSDYRTDCRIETIFLVIVLYLFQRFQACVFQSCFFRHLEEIAFHSVGGEGKLADVHKSLQYSFHSAVTSVYSQKIESLTSNEFHEI